MISQLPSEIIYHIAAYLPALSTLLSLARTCRRLYKIILVEDSHVFRHFVKNNFPSIETPAYWKDAAVALTSRSRALDRHALIGRFVVPPRDAAKVGSHQSTRRDNPTIGYRPAIDSYEVWNGEKWADRKEVLAWGAGDEVMMRIKQLGSRKQEKWLVFNDLDHISSYDDICGLRLLRPEQHGKEADREHLIFGRIRGDLVHIVISPDEATYEYKQKFATHGFSIDRMDLSRGSEPVLAAHLDSDSIALYHTASEETEVQPFVHIPVVTAGATRAKYSGFLSSHRLAVGTGGLGNSLSVFTILPERVSICREIGVDELDIENRNGIAQKAHVTAIAPLKMQGVEESSGDVFLAGWGDREVRLHDLRSNRPYESTYRDSTDDNPVYSIQPFSQDRFLVGVGADAVLKIFDLRMQSNYSYLNAKIPHARNSTKPDANRYDSTAPSTYLRKDFSLFLSHRPPKVVSNGRRHFNSTRSYRGAIYALSTPSPSSPTVYAGISDGVFRLDFASTDDLTGSCRSWFDEILSLDINMDGKSRDRVLEMSGYERPDPDDFTTVSRLRTQRPFWSLALDEEADRKSVV